MVSEELTLQQGLNRIAVRATNRFEKTREEIVTIESQSFLIRWQLLLIRQGSISLSGRFQSLLALLS